MWYSSYNNVFFFSFSGIPGVGKSTAINELEKTNMLQQELEKVYLPRSGSDNMKTLKVLTVHEPSKLWRDKGYLQAFYENPNENALAFQMIVFDTHVDAVQAAIAPYKDRNDVILVVLVERSMWDQLLFWKLQIDLKRNKDDILDDAAYMGVWQKWNRFLPPIQKIFYCKTSNIQTTMQRVQQRARREELGISKSGQDLPNSKVGESVGGLTLEYMTALNDKHDAWYTEPMACMSYTNHVPRKHTEMHHIPCKHINMDLPYHNDTNQLRKLAKLLANEIVEYL